jgi:hypothetical protein
MPEDMFGNVIALVIANGAVLIVPGLNFALVSRTALECGLRFGLMTALRITSGIMVDVALAMLGSYRIFAGHPLLFGVIKWMGVCEAMLDYSFRQVVLVAVSDPSTLRSRLDIAQPDIPTLLATEAAQGPTPVDPRVFEEMRSRIEKDIDCLRTFDLHPPGRIGGHLTIFNGEDDPWCDHRAAEVHWGQMSSGKTEYLRFSGRHLPGAGDWRTILDGTIGAGGPQSTAPFRLR